ncbi:aminomethyl-transferring glycine dehydrogenase subunit GcvPA [Moraxella sp.]|uniref:aminomethyl-transferring glycine dehydrogenase subunit GcvPA n=1 Tax=Moraxella sp. TaxID=479 RepID=UPI002632E99D|nr:aminomethyl-transferring glycine dehydrogenase subunit GcvPA [Moraxella sp.]MCP3897441.1 aminomethyl-transferring glycine dehydrogenase subunit GcvPA [Moraxella sp.]
MPYIPHTSDDITAMLATIGVGSIEDLFDEIPAALRCGYLEKIPPALTEMEIGQLMRQRANQDSGAICFIGAGAYEHHIPAAVWEIATRGEFYSAYTPYQAEASQGTLQLLYEFQTMMANLTGMEASNASLYDGASALAEAVLMAVRLTKSKAKNILMPTTVHPIYRRVVKNFVKNQGIRLIEIPYDAEEGIIAPDSLAHFAKIESAALVIPQPNFFGCLEAVDELTDWAYAQGILVIGVVNPLTLAVLSPPGDWGTKGADIVCGEGQPLGIPLSYGGPYFGLLCSKKGYVRQMPGRIVGRTVDLDGNTGYTLTLQAREQHIRRSKATSNICTNQGLMATAATIHTALLGAEGLEQVALTCHANTTDLVEKLTDIAGVNRVFKGPFFHEAVLQLEKPVDQVLRELATHLIFGGYDLTPFYPELGQCLLVCATEMRTQADIDRYAEKLQVVLKGFQS